AAVLNFEVDQVRVIRIDAADEAVAAADADPVFVDRPAAAQAMAGPSPTAIVLQTAIDPVRLLVVHAAVIELANGHVIEEVPMGHAVVSDIEAAVAADDHVSAVFRIDPERVLVRMDDPGGAVI